MEKIKQKPLETVKNIIISILTLSMLLLSVAYIGGSQFFKRKAAIVSEDMPTGSAKVGNALTSASDIYKKNLLCVSYAAIRYGEKGGGAHGGEAAAKALFDFALEHIHSMLSSSSTLIEASSSNAVTDKNYIYISLASSLPYQVIYTLSGEYIGAAQSDLPIDADKLILTFDANGEATLYLSNGISTYTSSATSSISLPEAAALSGDSRLSDFFLTENLIAVSKSQSSASRLTLSADAALTKEQRDAILSCLGYNPESIKSTAAENEYFSTVSPLGTLDISSTAICYTAASDNGIPLSKFMPQSKDAASIGFYDILIASVNLVETIKDTAPQNLGGSLSLYLHGIYRESDIYTVVLGLFDGSASIMGEAYPYFAKLTVRDGMLWGLDMRFLKAQRSGYMSTLFPAEWNYLHAITKAPLLSFKLVYDLPSLPMEEIIPEWHYTTAGGADK